MHLRVPCVGCAPVAATASTAKTPAPATVTKPPAGYTKTVVLWPNGAPGALGTGDGDVPKMFVYPATGTGIHSAVIVMPGGGYTHLAIEKEGGAEARWLNEHGVTAFVLEYRLGPRYHFPSPMLDGARAVRYVRSHAAELDVAKDRIGLWGFSAGGHLAGYLAAVHDAGEAGAADPIDRVSDRPDFAIVSYGRFSMDESIPRTTNMEGLLGDHPTQAMLDADLGGEAGDEGHAALLYLLDYSGPDGELDECDGVLRCAEAGRRVRRSCISSSAEPMGRAWRRG